MVKIMYFLWNPDLKLLYMSWNFYRKIMNILIQILMCMEHFEIYLLKFISKLISRKLTAQLNSNLHSLYFYGVTIIIIRVFWTTADPSLQAQEPSLQFCLRQVFHHKLGKHGSNFARDWIDTVASRCFPHSSLSLASEQTSKDLKISQRHQRGGEESGFG